MQVSSAVTKKPLDTSFSDGIFSTSKGNLNVAEPLNSEISVSSIESDGGDLKMDNLTCGTTGGGTMYVGGTKENVGETKSMSSSGSRGTKDETLYPQIQPANALAVANGLVIQHRASAGVIKVKLVSASPQWDNKAEVEVDCENPDEVVDRMLQSIVDKFPPSCVISVEKGGVGRQHFTNVGGYVIGPQGAQAIRNPGMPGYYTSSQYPVQMGRQMHGTSPVGSPLTYYLPNRQGPAERFFASSGSRGSCDGEKPFIAGGRCVSGVKPLPGSAPHYPGMSNSNITSHYPGMPNGSFTSQYPGMSNGNITSQFHGMSNGNATSQYHGMPNGNVTSQYPGMSNSNVTSQYPGMSKSNVTSQNPGMPNGHVQPSQNCGYGQGVFVANHSAEQRLPSGSQKHSMTYSMQPGCMQAVAHVRQTSQRTAPFQATHNITDSGSLTHTQGTNRQTSQQFPHNAVLINTQSLVHEVPKFVPKVEVREVLKEVAKYEIDWVEKFVDVPQVSYVYKYEEVPQIQEVVKHVPKYETVDVAREVVKYVPKIVQKIVEQIVEVPGAEKIQVVRPQAVDTPFVVPKFTDRSVPVIMAQCIIPEIEETDDVVEVEVCKYVPYLVPVDVYVPVPVTIPVRQKTDNGQQTEHPCTTADPAVLQQLMIEMNPHLQQLEIFNFTQQHQFQSVIAQSVQQARDSGVAPPQPIMDSAIIRQSSVSPFGAGGKSQVSRCSSFDGVRRQASRSGSRPHSVVNSLSRSQVPPIMMNMPSHLPYGQQHMYSSVPMCQANQQVPPTVQLFQPNSSVGYGYNFSGNTTGPMNNVYEIAPTMMGHCDRANETTLSAYQERAAVVRQISRATNGGDACSSQGSGLVVT